MIPDKKFYPKRYYGHNYLYQYGDIKHSKFVIEYLKNHSEKVIDEIYQIMLETKSVKKVVEKMNALFRLKKTITSWEFSLIEDKGMISNDYEEEINKFSRMRKSMRNIAYQLQEGGYFDCSKHFFNENFSNFLQIMKEYL